MTRAIDAFTDFCLKMEASALPPSSSAPWWRADQHQLKRPKLIARNAVKSRLRGWFLDQDFTEVEAAALQVSPGNEAHLHPFATDLVSADGVRRRLYLHTSPEFACKKLLAAGERRIFDFARVWRNRERGPLHHPEFTMLEWYRADRPYQALMDDCADILSLAARTGGRSVFQFRGRSADPFQPPERVTVADAFQRFAGIDLLSTLIPGGAPDRDRLASACVASGVRVADDDTWSDIFSRVMVARVEPNLGNGRATILFEYPASEAALARLSPDDPRVAQRFELYACGVELANAFCELTDPAEQRRRFDIEMDEKVRVYGERVPIDEAFLAALSCMPPASGAALGFDRLAMLAVGAEHIEEVIWTPVVADVEAPVVGNEPLGS